MKIEVVRATPFRLPLRAALRSAHATITERGGWLLELGTRAGLCGWGEASPLPSFGTETAHECRAALPVLARHVLGREAAEVEIECAEFEALAPAAPVARAGFESALLDLCARAERRGLAQWWADRHADRARPWVEVNALLGEAAPGALAQRARALASEGFLTFKIKLGARAFARDLDRVRAVREALGAEPRIRLDANGAWSEEEARSALVALAPLGIEAIEQPVAALEIDAMARLRSLELVPIAADESVTDPHSARAVIERRAADWLVLKPAALGGLGVSRALAERAAAAGLGCWVTTLIESSIGVAGALALAAALPGSMPACGLATGALLARDLACLPRPGRGRMPLPVGAGLGVVPRADWLETSRCGDTIEWRA